MAYGVAWRALVRTKGTFVNLTLNGLKRWHETMRGSSAWDDVTGADLDTKMVEEARREEIEFIRNMRVYEKVPRSWAWRAGKKVIGVRWIDVNKGDSINPKYRSRLVAK